MANPSEKLHPNRQEDEQDMEMKPVIVGPPAYGSPDPETAAGALVAVEDHPLELADDYGADVVMPEAPAKKDGPPAKSASREEWDEFARSQGVDPEEFSSKDDLIDFLS